jgi:hypothetical protein
MIGIHAITIYLGRRIIQFEEISGFFLEGVARHSGAFGTAVVPIGVLVV